ncbi:MAG: tetratricopeptide repeat protein [Balneolaceae bacterium]
MDNIKDQIDTILLELEQNPEDAGSWNDLGIGYFLLGKYQDSIDALKKAIRLNTDNETYHFNLANSFDSSDQLLHAIDHYLHAINIRPDHIPSLNNLADLYEVTGEVEKAHELFTYLTKINPDDPLSFFNLGNFMLRQNQHITAVRNYEKALEKDSGFVDAYHNIAWVLLKAGATEKALEFTEAGLLLELEHEDLKNLLHLVK